MLVTFLVCAWVLAASVTACLPMRMQYPPGIALLFAAPPLIAWFAVEHGAIWGVLGLAGFASIFRNPIIYLLRRMHPPEDRG